MNKHNNRIKGDARASRALLIPLKPINLFKNYIESK